MSAADQTPPDFAPYERKNVLRATARAQLAAMPPAEREERSRQLVIRLRELPSLRFARRVLLFAPLPTEPNIDPLWSLGSLVDKQCAYPRVEGMTMRLYYVRGLGELESTRRGLREPSPTAAREAELQDLDAVLVPGLAFNKEGVRLGRGGGFYDRLLANRNKRLVMVGCCFATQRVDDLPRAGHDVLMDYVCTDEGILI